MSAIAARFEPQRARLWGGSAFAVLLAHLAIAALLLLHFHWQQPVLAGNANALDVEIASPSASLALPSAAAPQLLQQQPAQLAPQPQPSAVRAVKPLAQLQPFPPQAEEPPQPPSVTPADTTSATLAAAQASVSSTSDLTVLAPTLGQVNTPPSPEQAWLAQVLAQLQRYKSYPRSAVKRQLQDTVTLHFTVNHAGQVLDSSVDSQHHYKVLEGEAKQMLRLAVPLPPLPRELSDGEIAVDVPVNFSLTFLKPSSPPSCVKPTDPGAAPAGAIATLAQMQAYRQRLNQYVAAARTELDCLGGSGAAGLVAHSAVTDQIHALVDGFNAQARSFQAHAAAQALQAQQARQAAAAALLAQVARGYAACTPPSARRPSAATFTDDTAQSYRKGLLGYEAAVRAYLACINQAQSAAVAQAGGVLTTDQRAELGRTAAQLANAAVLPFDQSVVGFNSQLNRLQKQAALAEARERAIPGVRIRAAEAFFPNSTWDTPAPLPAGNCFSIVRVGPTYQAQLCKGTYVTEKFVHGFNQAPGGLPVNLGTDGVQPNLETAEMENSHPTTTAYAISQMQVSATHVVMTIGRKSDAAASSKEDNWNALHLDLVLSADRRQLVGHCWTAQKRWDCQLSRHN